MVLVSDFKGLGLGRVVSVSNGQVLVSVSNNEVLVSDYEAETPSLFEVYKRGWECVDYHHILG